MEYSDLELRFDGRIPRHLLAIRQRTLACEAAVARQSAITDERLRSSIYSGKGKA